MWQVTMTRTGFSLATGAVLALDPLVIDGNPHTSAFHLTEEDCSWPAFQVDLTLPPTSRDISGDVAIAGRIGSGTFGLKIAAHGANFTATRAAMLELEACTSQFEYDLTFEVSGVEIGTYKAKAALPLWGALDSAFIRAAINQATITIPLNPIGAS